MNGRVPLYARDGSLRGFALVDSDDVGLVAGRTWRLHSAAKSGADYMHRLILGAPVGVEVDHVNRDKLDNRRSNLRLVSHAENHQNHGPRGGTSQFRNVAFERGAWVVSGRLNGQRYYLGRFASEEEANAAAVAHRREHAPFAVEALA